MERHQRSDYEKRKYILKNIDLLSSIPVVALVIVVDVIAMIFPLEDLIVGSRNFTAMFSLKVTLLIIGDIIIFYFGYTQTRRMLKRRYG